MISLTAPRCTPASHRPNTGRAPHGQAAISPSGRCRQIRACTAWLPPGWFIAAVYSDVESGATDLDKRSRTESWRVLTDAGIPRGGGMADLLAEAASPSPRFAVVVCEDIERSARDTFNSLKPEKELGRPGIPLFATDEPADIAGVNSATLLVRRVKQG